MNELFQKANLQWESGELRSAFRLFLAGAKLGDVGAQHNLGYFYDEGIGVHSNRAAAMYWYKRAYRGGSRVSASNIAVMFREEGEIGHALAWFERAVRMKDADAHLEIGKIYMNTGDVKKATSHLKRVLSASEVDATVAAKEEAEKLLQAIAGSERDASTVRSRKRKRKCLSR
jgi:TPR repeat protein